MSFSIVLLTPLALLLPAAGAVEAVQGVQQPVPVASQEISVASAEAEAPRVTLEVPAVPASRPWPFRFVSTGFRPDSVYQVRIEQRMTIRIAPRARAPQVRPNMFVGVPEQAIGPNFIERRIGRCLPVEAISGVQAQGGNDLILYLSDRRVIRAELERSCRARDFYSGFYLSRSADGKLCVERDALQSRSGANCKLTQIRQLVEAGN